jgi:hypothetical protein
MKTKLLPVLFLLFSLSAFSQSFDGVAIDGDLSVAISKYKEKGYELISKEKEIAILKGTAAGKKINLFILTTPKSKIIYRAVIFLPEHEDWQSLKDDYIKYKEILINKYGKPSSIYENFKEPFKEGEGNEMIAVTTKKCQYVTYWFDDTHNTDISIEISDLKQIKITYENSKNSMIREKEKLEIEKTVF